MKAIQCPSYGQSDAQEVSLPFEQGTVANKVNPSPPLAQKLARIAQALRVNFCRNATRVLVLGIALVGLLVGPAYACHPNCVASGWKDVPLPNDVQIVAPAQNFEFGQDQFSGMWYGAWDNGGIWDDGQATVLVVEKVSADAATVIYAVGSYTSSKDQWAQRYKGKFVDGALIVRLNTATVTYRLNKDGTLAATYSRTSGSRRNNTAILKKQLRAAKQPMPPMAEASKTAEQPVTAGLAKPVDQLFVAAPPAAPGPAEPTPPKPADRAPAITDMKKGEGGSEVKGSAGPSGAQGAASDLERCDKPLATLAVVEPQNAVIIALSGYHLGSPTGLIRLMVQQSNCFLVLERGAGMQNVMQERALAGSGQLRQGSNMGGGQMITADYVMTPSVVFSEDNAGGIGGAVGGLIGHFVPGGAAIGGVAGGLKFKEAQTSLLLADTRTSLQVAAAEGSAKKADFNLGGVLLGGGAGVGLGGYTNTNEGKVVASSFLDNYNGIVRTVRGNPSLQREVGSVAGEAAARPQAGAVFNEGDVLRPKIANVKLFAAPSDGSQEVGTLGKGDEVVLIGKEQDGFLNVESAKGKGWVKKILMTR